MTVDGISLLTRNLIALGLAFLGGSAALRLRGSVEALFGEGSELTQNLFWIGALVPFLGVMIVLEEQAPFGENRVVHFDNASGAASQVVVNRDRTIDIDPHENVAAYLRLGWNDIRVRSGDSGVDWCGKVRVPESGDFVVFNLGRANQYGLRTSAWGG